MRYNPDYEYMILHRALVEKDHIGVFLNGHHFTNETLGSIWDVLKDDDTGDIIELAKNHDEKLLHEILDKVTSHRYPPAKLASEIVRNHNTQSFIKELDLVKGLVSAGMEPEVAMKQLSEVDTGNVSSNEPENLIKAMGRVYKDIEDVSSGKKKSTMFIPTNLKFFDDSFVGLERSAYTIIAARSSMGKTSFGLKIATNVAKQGFGVLVITLEMSNDSLVYRIYSAEAKLDLQLLRIGKIDGKEVWRKLSAAQSKFGECKNMFLDDSPSLTLSQLLSKIKRHKKRYGLDMVMIDYLGLLSSDNKNLKKHEYISEISNAMPGLAKELDIALVALAQIGRGTEQRTDKRPMMSDLRDSGSIEQDADAIIMLYREEYYNKKPANEGVAEIIMQKQRNGPTGTVLASFDKEYATFSELDPEKAFNYAEYLKK